MSSQRFVALGLARPRASWFTEVARWSTTAALPLEFVKCLSVEETQARLSGGRRFSVMLVDGSIPGLDRDLIGRAGRTGATVIVVADETRKRDWHDLGATTVLRSDFDRWDLLQALETYCEPVPDPADDVPAIDGGRYLDHGPRGRMVCVTGAAGSGTSTLAIALTQGLVGLTNPQSVLLADLALQADQALLHDTGEVIPGIQEIVEAHRAGRPDGTAIQALTFEIQEGGYHLALGLRRHRDWATLRPQALAAALDNLRASYTTVVCDVDPDVEGERECGPIDVEERNLLARSALRDADLTVITATPAMTSIARLVRIVHDLTDFGIEPERILPVVNKSPKSFRGRRDISSAVSTLANFSDHIDGALPQPILLPDRKKADEALRDQTPLPDVLVRPLTAAVKTRLSDLDRRTSNPREPEIVVAGSMGSWHMETEVG